MTQLDKRLAGLSPEKLALLTKRLRTEQSANGGVAPIARRSRQEEQPLAFAQQRLWFLDQLAPGNPFYNIPAALRLSGRLDTAALEASLATIARRHEVLRARVIARDGRPIQHIAADDPSQRWLSVTDLSAVAPAEREAEVQRLATEEARRPFDLAADLLLRASLLRLGDEEHVLLMTLHHIVADGWSIGLLVRELGTLYSAAVCGQAAQLPDLPIQYGDYAHWQAEQIQEDGSLSTHYQRQLDYWRHKLEGCPTVLELPADRPRPPVLSYRGAHHHFEVPHAIAAGLRMLAKQERTTLYTVLLAAFQVLLYRYSGQEHFCVGTPVAGRTRAELEPLIGLFVNTLALRADLSGEPGFRALLRRVREAVLDAQNHQELPFEMLVEALNPERDPSRTPLFQVMFDLETDALATLALDKLRVQRLVIEMGSAKTDLLLAMEEHSGGLYGILEYSSDLFDTTTIERMAGHYLTMLLWIVADPDQPITRLSLLDEAERSRLIVEWNATALPFPRDRCLHQLIEEQAARTPDANAVIADGQTLSYGELNQRANQLAHHLRGLGVGPNMLVGLAVERSPAMIVGLLGILKAGGAYLPLDPSYPAERLHFMLADAGVAFVVTQERLQNGFELPGLTAIRLDADQAMLAQLPTGDLPCITVPENWAYVIYTSGSTGQPKGVVIPHCAVVNHNLAVVRGFQLEPEDRMLQFASISFDAAVEEIFPTLIRGATLVLTPAGPMLGPHELLDLVAHVGVTVLDLPTAYWHLLTGELANRAQPLPVSVRLVVVGGEVASGEALATWREVAPDVRWMNTYGPTEATVIATWYTPDASEVQSEPEARVLIGRPIDNVQLYVLDQLRQLVPTGVPGELYVGGAGIALGYLNRPELTAERFVNDPFSTEPGAMLYRTGDRVRYRADGNLEFLGRSDHQVKIRGFRVELGEIEAVLARHPSIQSAVVATVNDKAGSKRLVAYLVADEQPAPASEALRARLRTQLPDYMIPAAFVWLEALPLTPNGKVDRRALPEPEEWHGGHDGAIIAPRTPVEQLLAGIWRELLGIEQVSVEDSFFDLGGHSLLATQLVARVRDAFQIDLPVRALFAAPTIAGLAEQINAGRTGEAGRNLPPLQPVPRDRPLPASFAQQRLWFLSDMQPESPLYTIAGALRLSGPLVTRALERAFTALVERHESLRTTFVSEDGQLFQVVQPATPMQLPVVDLRGVAEADREATARHAGVALAHQPFDLARGPLFRAGLARLADDDHVLAVTLHHTIADGWSLGLIINELGALYRAIMADEEPQLAPLPLQYGDYSAWQREWLQGEALTTHLEYWRDTLADSLPLLELPTDRPRPGEQSYRGAQYHFSLPRELSAALQRLSQAEGVTLFMTLLAAFQVLLSRYSGQTDIKVGTPIAGRRWSALESIVGCFVNTLVLRADLSDSPSFRDLLQQVRETTLRAYEHQDVPFELVVDALNPERDLAYAPIFQVMFALQNTPPATLELPGLTIRQVALDTGIASFDLSLLMEEREGALTAILEYSSDLFDAETIARMAGHFRQLLEGIVANPTCSVAELPLLTTAERHQLLVEWNATATAYDERCVHELFSEQAARTPSATAVVYEDRRLSYAELNQRSNQLAHHLRALGVGPDTLVAICLERSPELIIAVLGVLKAGGAYVPLDPTYPTERLAFMLEDAHPAVLITDRVRSRQLLQSAPRAGNNGHAIGQFSHLSHVLELDSDGPLIADRPITEPESGVAPNNLAYVIYTSGSTGRPKGALITHRGLTNYLTWALGAYPTTAGRGAPVHSSLAFDLTVTSLFTPLLSGGCAALLPDDGDIAALGAALRAPGGFSLVKITPAHLELLNQQLAPAEAVGATRAFIIGGENLSGETIAFWQQHAPATVLVNEYGPTETVVGCCVYQVQPGKRFGGVVPIGRPIANTRLYVLDPHGQPVPVGVVGELYIGGAGVARGYLNRPELTAERFLPDPFVDEPGARLYRTGDLVRYRSDGNLECLGRTDHQVKIRGFRIELGELETTLNMHPDVQEAVVAVRDDGPGGKLLVGYVVPSVGWRERVGDAQAMAEAQSNLAAEVRASLQARLPDYMVPAVIVPMMGLPLTPNGKVDRRALPAPELRRAQASIAIAPRTPLERQLAAIWAQLLGAPEVGIHDNFFELGGDSILSIQVVARAAQAGIKLTTRQLFQHPTVAGLAAVAETSAASSAEQDPVTGPLPLTPIQRWFFEQELPTPNHWNQAVLLEVRERLDPETLRQSVRHILAHHDALRMRFSRTPEGWSQHCEGLEAADQPVVQILDLTHTGETEWQQALEHEAAKLQGSLNLGEGPLLRVGYFDTGDLRPGRLLIVAHHLVIDTVSWRVLLEDLQDVCGQLRAGQPVALPPKTSSYRQWAQHIEAHAASPEVQLAAVRWAEWLAGPASRLPVDDPRGLNTVASERSLSVELDHDATRALLRDVPTTYGTEINDALVAALGLALADWAGVPAQLIDLESHGRDTPFEDLDLSRTVGWFTNVFPVALQLGEARNPGEALKLTKEQLRRVRTHALGYGLLRYLSPDPHLRERMRGLPRPEVVLNYLGQLDQGIAEAGLFALANETPGPTLAPDSPRDHLIGINGGVVGGRLELHWSYSASIHRPDTIEKVAQRFLDHLRAIIAHCQSPAAGGYTPADFPDIELGQDDLDALIAEIGLGDD